MLVIRPQRLKGARRKARRQQGKDKGIKAGRLSVDLHVSLPLWFQRKAQQNFRTMNGASQQAINRYSSAGSKKKNAAT
jgi:hypothetical protein